MSPGPVLLKRFVRNNKIVPYVDQVELLNSNPTYANIKYPSERESTVSVHDLAPCPERELRLKSSMMEQIRVPQLSPYRRRTQHLMKMSREFNS